WIIGIRRGNGEGPDVIVGAGTVKRTRELDHAAIAVERCGEQGNAGKQPLIDSHYPGILLLCSLFIGPRERIDFIDVFVRRIGAERRPIERRGTAWRKRAETVIERRIEILTRAAGHSPTVRTDGANIASRHAGRPANANRSR